MIRISLAIVLFASSIASAPADFQGEVPVSSSSLTNAEQNQLGPSIASNGTDFLVVWADARPASGIYATRLTAKGEVLDPSGIRISGSGPYTGSIVVLWTGDAYSILWVDYDYLYGSGSGVKLARVDSSGHVITPSRTILAAAYGYGQQFAATDGSRIVIAYGARGGNIAQGYLRAAIVAPDGEIIAKDVILPTRGSNNFGASVTSNGSEFLFAWLSGGPIGEIDAIRMGPSGSIIDNAALTAVSPAYLSESPTLGSDGQSYLFICRDTVGPGTLARRVSSDLRVFDPTYTISHIVLPQQAGLLWTGSKYIALLGTIAFSLDRNGQPLGEGKTVIPPLVPFGIAQLQSIATNGRELAAAWSDMRNGTDTNKSYDVFGAVGDVATLSMTSETMLAWSGVSQRAPSVASSGNIDYVVWTEDSGLYGSRVTFDGRYLDGRGARLSATTTSSPRVVFDGSNFIVAWKDVSGNALVTAALDANGTSLSGGWRWPLSPCSGGLDLVTGPRNETLLVFAECVSGVKAIRLNALAFPIDSMPVRVSLPNAYDPAPSAAWNGHEYLVAWQEQVILNNILLPPAYQGNIWAARLSPELTLYDTAPIPIAVTQEHEYLPSVASDGDEFLIAYARYAYPSPTLHGRHISAAGIPLDDLELLNATVGRVAWDGRRYIVLAQTAANDIIATHAGRSSDPLPRDVIDVSSTPETETDPALVAVPDDRVDVVYARVSTAPQDAGVYRVFMREFKSPRPRARAVRR